MAESVEAASLAPGNRTAVQLGGETVMVANVGGSFYAVQDACTHRGCSLSEGRLEGSELTCACHGGRFDVTTGEVLGGPPRDSLKTFKVSVSGGKLTVAR